MSAAIERGSASAEALMMGRLLYSEWASYLPSQADEVPFAGFMNNIQKYVMSNTLTAAQ